MTRKRGKFYILSLLIVLSILLILISIVSASRLPTVGGDSDQWGTILNEYLNKLSGQNATELNQTMVNGTNIHSSSINTSHIKDNTITGSDISNTTNITTTGYGFFDYLGSLTNRVTSLFAQDVNFNGTVNLTGTGDFIVNNSDLFVDVSTGNVGIGTTGPDGTLHVHSASAGTISADADADELVIEGSSETGLSILAGNAQRARIFFGDDGDAKIGRIQYNHADNSLEFFTAGSENVVIDNSGNVGIGTTSPSHKLDVRGIGNFSGTVYINNGTDVSSFGNVSGDGNANVIPIWTANNTLGNSSITDDGSTITITL